MTITQILDTVLPYNEHDKRCAFDNAIKAKKRNDLINLIFAYQDGKDVVLPENVLNLLNEKSKISF